jgi:6-phosphogluconolactonase
MKVDQFVVHHSAQEVAAAVAGRMVTRLVELIDAQDTASLVLGSGTEEILRALAQSPGADAIDWSRVEIFFSDELFVDHEDPARLEQQSRAILFGAHPPARIHSVPSPRDFSAPEEAANAYAVQLGLGTTRMPAFDLVILAIGSDAHVAGLYPEHPVLHDNRWAAAVRGVSEHHRVTMCVPLLSNADEIWLVAVGADHEDAVRLTLSERAGIRQAPSAAIRGKYRTALFVDVSAAGEHAGRIASP